MYSASAVWAAVRSERVDQRRLVRRQLALLSGRWSDLTGLLRAAVAVPSAAAVLSATLSLLVSSSEQQLSYMDSRQSSRFMLTCADVVGQYLQAMQQRAATSLHGKAATDGGRAAGGQLRGGHDAATTAAQRAHQRRHVECGPGQRGAGQESCVCWQ